jgi:t-SNARE complex subunit (syntaxin)
MVTFEIPKKQHMSKSNANSAHQEFDVEEAIKKLENKIDYLEKNQARMMLIFSLIITIILVIFKFS